jgi:hypothetical protein
LDRKTNQTIIGYSASTYDFPSSIVDWPIIALSYDATDPAEACEPLPEDNPHLSKIIPLVRRGTCTFATKKANLEAFGATYILVYNNENPIISPGTNDYDSLLGLIEAKAGQAIINTLKAGGSITATFLNDPPVVGLENIAGGIPSAYTSWGGLYDLSIKPDIAALGGSIFSTWLDNSYAALSSTSMATPYIVGIAALYVGAYGGRVKHGAGFAKMLNRRIITSGASLPWSNGSLNNFGLTTPVSQAGRGMVNAFKALQYNTSLSFDKFELNDTSHFFDQYHDIDITSNGPASISYTFTVEDAAGLEALEKFNPKKRLNKLSTLVPIKIALAIEFPSRGFTLKAGETRKAR